MYQPYYIISNKILKNIGIIEACREIINNAALVPAWEKKFQEEAIVRQVHHGTHLEGNPLNLSEAARAMAGETVVGRARDVQEVINYRNVLKFVEQWVKQKAFAEKPASFSSPQLTSEDQKSPQTSEKLKSDLFDFSGVQNRPRKADSAAFCEELIKKIHRLTTEKILPKEKVAKFRTKQVVVRNSQTGEVTFRPPPAVEVPFLLEEFFAWLNGPAAEIHPVLKSGIAQYEIVRIHPFLDGNGRVARALATLILYKEGYDIRRFFSLEEYYDRNAQEYYQALQSVQKERADKTKTPDQRRYNLTPWLEYFTQGLAIELTRIKEKIQKLSVDVHLKERLGGKQIFLSERQIKIIEHIQKAGFLQNKMFRKLFPMISEDTILRELKDLMKKGIIVKKGRTKGARYILRQ